jgi:serine/threonine protein kinase
MLDHLAHQDLKDADILHRDISANNIMVNLSSAVKTVNRRHGRLIDLDMAKDLQEPPRNTMRPEITVGAPRQKKKRDAVAQHLCIGCNSLHFYSSRK